MYNLFYPCTIQVQSVPQQPKASSTLTSTSYAMQPTYVSPSRYNPYYPYPCPPSTTPTPHMGVNFIQPSMQQQTQQFKQLNISNPPTRVFFKDSNIILKYSILGDCFGLKKICL